MDRVFLGAKVLFSAAYREESGLLKLWTRAGIVLCSSSYAIEEARRNLPETAQRQRLHMLTGGLELSEADPRELPAGITLREKDVPILLAARGANATHLLTGDVRDFGPYFGRKILGILILRPADYLKAR